MKRGGTILHMSSYALLINFVTNTEGIPQGVLIRAIKPEEGLSAMSVTEVEKKLRSQTPNQLAFSISTGYRWRYVK